MKLLITGMAGFIGSRLFRYLTLEEPEIEVRGFDLAYGQDVRNKQQVEEAVSWADTIIHLAALTHVDTSIADPGVFYQTNVGGTLNFLEALRCHKTKKFVQVSSSEVYGSMTEEEYRQGFRQAEDYPIRPHSPYAATKVAQDRMCYAFYQTYGLPIVIVRPFNNIGPGQDIRKVVPKFINQVMQAGSMTLYGDGCSTRDWVYVDDVTRGLWLATELPLGTVVNLASGISYQIRDLAYMVAEIASRFGFGLRRTASVTTFVSHTDEREGHVKHLRGSYALARELTGWKPTHDIEASIYKTWASIVGAGPTVYRGGEGK